ncbi:MULTISPECIES: ECF-type sigma factor negative effector [Bacillus]|uniref:ECF-type sigma factor negative effector n=1 Tax=Bacillus TaxID=1386 RepID=UPI000353DC2D|nr:MULTISPECIES: ECF-type sigma factor negative effector [Bacillus]MCU4722689.1 anti-sigma factor [Bacillus cereus]EPF08744.1 ECF-type sigma factor negative effector [Bacillus cereus BAG1O-3]MBG9750105.1 ECF-type sigma factor negative effector [Bacillus thuringiensis]MBG9782245.1 ECF-type sigma factor negative effector [Bacillus thuringiensis]MBG9923931.1 ECF-type sigma factor negative effector [Bacillus thuringiensis]
MTNSKNSKEIYELAEKIALDDFDKSEEQHEFSHTYTRKKKLFMEEMKLKGEQQQKKSKRNRMLIAAACLLIGMPTTVFGAVKVYNMIVQKQNYEVNVSLTNKDSKKSDQWYKLKVGKLPENMEAIDDTAMKYSFKDNYANGGFSFVLWRVGGNSDFPTLYSKSYEEKEINGKKAVIVHRETGKKDLMMDRVVFLFFEEEGIMLQSYIGNDINEEQMVDVLGNISLEPTSKEKASHITDYDKKYFSEESKPKKTKVIPLKKDSKRLFHIGQKVPVTIIMDNSKIEYVIEKVEVFDSIKDFKQENFYELGLGILSRNQALDQGGQLIPYRRDKYKIGNGKDSIDQLVESKLIHPKFVYLTTTVKNIGKQATEEIYMHPSIQVLKSKGNVWNYAERDGIAEKNIMTGEVDYLEPHGDGKSFYNIGSIRPGQTVKVNLGYFVDEDKIDSIFLDAFRYSGSSGTENMNEKNRWWFDIRQQSK